MTKAKCYCCGEPKGEAELLETEAATGGSYKRAPRAARVRICHGCVTAKVEEVRQLGWDLSNKPWRALNGRIEFYGPAREMGLLAEFAR